MIFVLLVVLLAPSLAEAAACPGSGLAFSCPANTTVATVNDTITAGSDGMVITFAAGSYSWATSITLSDSKGVTLICESVGGCVVAVGGSFLVNMATSSASNTKAYRVSGFEWQNAPSGSYTLAFYGAADNVKMTNIRVDHNTFSGYPTDATALLLGDNSRINVFYGLFDHNTITGAQSFLGVLSIGSAWAAPPESSYPGTANNFYIEDNTFSFTALSASTICIDGWGGDAIVFRFNTVLNCLPASHGVIHGGGPWNFEFYGNHVTLDAASAYQDCYRCFHHLGSGTLYVFGNTFTPFSGHSATPISIVHYRDAPVGTNALADPPGQCDGLHTTTGSVFTGAPPDGNRSTTATHRGYPCYNQPGRDGAGVLKPVYAWNNAFTDNGAIAPLVAENVCGVATPCYFTNHLQQNRDWYNAVSVNAQTTSSSPFDGTTGMGFGTLANRPATCTATGDAADAGTGGVGYFVTNTGTWNQSASNAYGNNLSGADGVLYGCTSTNTWTAIYTPYTYPHPLQGVVAGNGAGVRGSKGLGLF